MKPATAKAKGRETEQYYVDYLRRLGYQYAERRHLAGADDMGDIVGIPGLCIEIKSAAHWKPIQWIRELRAETINAKADVGYIAARPKGQPNPEEWVAIMPMPEFMKLLAAAGEGPAA